MTAPYFPRAKSLDGRSARELFALERVVDDGDEVLPPGGLAEPPVVTLPIADGADVTVMLEQGEDETDYWPSQKPYYDATSQTEIRLVTDVEDAGAADAELVGQYSATPDDPDSFAAPAVADVAVTIATVGPQKSGWYPLSDAARADVVWTIRARGGDGVETPAVGKAHLQFRQAPTVRYTRWYWRTGAPEEQPTEAPYIGAADTSEGCDPPLDREDWLTPTPADVAADAGRLLRTKGNDADSIIPTSNDVHKDVAGPVLSFVSPPLAAQAFNNFPYRAMFVGQAPSANTTGWLSVVLKVYRPSTDTIVAYSYPAGDDAWYRFIARSRIIDGYFEAWDGPPGIPSSARIPDFATEAGDRLVLDVGTSLTTACGFLATTEGSGTWIQFNGGTDGYGADDLLADGSDAASYLDLPSWVLFTSETA